MEVLHDFNPDFDDSSAALERALMGDSKSSTNNVSLTYQIGLFSNTNV